MECLAYPFDSAELLRNRRKIKRQLLSDNTVRIKKRIAVLGGSTTDDIVVMLELFLLNEGIEPIFYQSEYNQYWQDAMFDNIELDKFHPDIIFIHTTSRNLDGFVFNMSDSLEETEIKLQKQYLHFESMWLRLKNKYNCTIIQNNFEMPTYRILGNKDSSDYHGKLWFINRINMKFAEFARLNSDFYIHDINYLSACYGIDKWSDYAYWYMYKYTMCMEAIPEFAFSLSNIIKSVSGMNKKVLALDLDNTLWGGIIGDDGQNGIEIGMETSVAQAYLEFQMYIKNLKKIGILLTICSKNNPDSAYEGLNHPDCVLHADDFIVIKANWNNKDENLLSTAEELCILPDSIVFADDNPAEREIVRSRLPMVSVPEIDGVENYIRILDKSGFFELTVFSSDDIKRNEMYKENIKRLIQQQQFADYDEYLVSLNMHAVIETFKPVYLERITQLTNKSNQFNLTTRRYTSAEIDEIYEDSRYIKLYGKLSDKFGDNGVVSVVIGKKSEDNAVLDIELWLMSCRVLKRNMEFAMLDTIVKECRECGIRKIRGYYYKTAKNSMVKDLYGTFGFKLVSSDKNENSVWELDTENYENKNQVINIMGNKEIFSDE